MERNTFYSYALLARDRATGKWLDQSQETEGPRAIGTWDYVFNRGFRACWYHNPAVYSEVMIKRTHLKSSGGDALGSVPTLSLIQEVWVHAFVMPIRKPRLGKAWTKVDNQNYELVVLVDNGVRLDDYDVKVAFMNKE